MTLIVLDSLNDLVERDVVMAKNPMQKHKAMGKLASSFKYDYHDNAHTIRHLAEALSIAIVVTNSQQGDQACYGNIWAHCVNTRLTIRNNPATITITKSPLAPVKQFRIQQSMQGFVEVKTFAAQENTQEQLVAEFVEPASQRDVLEVE